MDEQSLLDAVHNDTSRQILTYTSETERSAEELAELIDVTQTTIYRKLEELVENDLVLERIHVDSSGDHYHEYRAAIDEVHVRILGEEVQVEVSRNEEAADTFTRVWESIRGDR